MENLPTPKLGNVTAITIATPDLEKSFAFYKMLGFSEVSRFDFPFKWIQITDGALLIMLREDPKPYIAMTYYANEMDNLVTELEQGGINFEVKPPAGDMLKRHVIKSPDGLTITLINNIDGFFVQPQGPTMLKMPQQDFFNPEKYINKTIGLFGEFAHPVKDLEASISFWGKLGFKAISKFASPYPWAILSDGLGVVGIHQTTHFSKPTITYFASDMKDKINKLKEAGLKDYTEESNANITLKTPEGQHINLFKLGM